MSSCQCEFGDDQGEDVTVPEADGGWFAIAEDFRLLHAAGVG